MKLNYVNAQLSGQSVLPKVGVACYLYCIVKYFVGLYLETCYNYIKHKSRPLGSEIAPQQNL